MLAKWQQLSAQEKKRAIGGIICIIGLLIYQFYYAPLNLQVKKLSKTLAQTQADTQWMRETSAQLNGTLNNASISEDLTNFIDANIKAMMGKDTNTQVKKISDTEVEVNFEKIALSQFWHWLNNQNKSGIQIKSFDVQKVGEGEAKALVNLTK